MTERKDDELAEVQGGAEWKIGIDSGDGGGSGSGSGSGGLTPGDGTGGTSSGDDPLDKDAPQGGDQSGGLDG